jgi:hypothetical protein
MPCLLWQRLQAKKVTKHLQKAAATGHGYTNSENPFGDANVTQRFVWGKKIEKQLQEGADVRELTAKAERERQLERLVCCPIHAAAFLPPSCHQAPQRRMHGDVVAMHAGHRALLACMFLPRTYKSGNIFKEK